MSVSLLLGLVYLISELLLTATRRSRGFLQVERRIATLLQIFRRRYACRYSLAADTAATTTNRSCIVASFALQPSLRRAKRGLREMANKLTRRL